MNHIGIYYSPTIKHFLLADIQQGLAYYSSTASMTTISMFDTDAFWLLRYAIDQVNDFEFICYQDDLPSYPELFI